MAAYTAIDDPSAYFKVQLYTGDGAANHAITFDDTDTDMQPDLVWIKNRDTTDSHCVFDAVRGATEVIYSNASTAGATDTDTLDSFTSDGFQVDADVKVNTDTEKYVAWNWKANGSGSANTDGSISSTVSVSATSGFSIVKFTTDSDSGNATIGHGLGVVPKMIIQKNTEQNYNWEVFHESVTSGGVGRMILNTTAALDTVNDPFGEVAPTSSVFTFNQTWNEVIGNDIIAYCFAEKQGFSKFGTYEGNGNADGTFVYTGFQPAWVMIKRTDAVYSWAIYDSIRYPENLASIPALWADRNNAEGAYTTVDFLSNGFKIRDTSLTINASGGDHVYMAFAEAPFVNSNGVPCNAR